MTKTRPFFIFVLVAITLLSFSTAFNNAFTNWDDPVHFLDNTAVKNMDIGRMFFSTPNNIYIPLTLLSFSLEYKLFGWNPVVFHVNNVLLHIGVVLLVYALALRLRLAAWVAFITALIFAVHPIHVESVAWVTERKDVLYALFYMLSLIFYWDFTQTGDKKKYIGSVAWALLSILSKPMAFSLPVILLALDWYARRSITKRVFLEKIPHAVVVVGVSLVTYTINSHTIPYSFQEAVCLWVWTFMFHLQKLFIPVGFSPFYAVPQPVEFLQLSYALSLAGFVALCYAAYKLRRDRLFIFSLIFYSVSISFIVIRAPWDFNNLVTVADRFMYLPCLGFCLWGAERLAQWHESVQPPARLALKCLGSMAVLWLAFTTAMQNNVWDNGIVLWTNVIEDRPNFSRAYINRCDAYLMGGHWKKALGDCNEAIMLDPKGAYKAYHNRGAIYLDRHDLDRALADFNQALTIEHAHADTFYNRGIVYQLKQDFQKAVEDFSASIRINPSHGLAFLSRGKMLRILKEYALAEQDLNQAVRLQPKNPKAYYSRSLLYFELKNYEKALDDARQARQLGLSGVEPYIEELTALSRR